ncbi:Protein kinase C-like 1 [Apophysomyces sp. BC1021]|nr:Protein kinase C-like 1 [Apophysomyces sp. BC1021]
MQKPAGPMCLFRLVQRYIPFAEGFSKPQKNRHAIDSTTYYQYCGATTENVDGVSIMRDGVFQRTTTINPALNPMKMRVTDTTIYKLTPDEYSLHVEGSKKVVERKELVNKCIEDLVAKHGNDYKTLCSSDEKLEYQFLQRAYDTARNYARTKAIKNNATAFHSTMDERLEIDEASDLIQTDVLHDPGTEFLKAALEMADRCLRLIEESSVEDIRCQVAMYHFISGYTTKVPGTEDGIVEPQATFSAYFGAPFLVLHPQRYASMLAKKISQHKADAWLINTGWIGAGAANGGKRCPLKYTRAIMDAIHSGELANAEFEAYDTFNLQIPKKVPNVPDELLNPRKIWEGAADEFNKSLASVAKMFQKNFKTYEDQAAPDTLAACPKI